MVSLMRRSRAVALAGFGGGFLAFAALASCGSRTGLPGETAGGDAGTDIILSPDHIEETIEEPTDEDVIEEMPLIDTNRPDVPVINPCPDAAATLIYVIGNSGRLYSFDPASSAFTTIGTIDCPGAGGSTPFSMAVDREGVAYVIFSENMAADGGQPGTGLYKVSTKTAECKATKYNAAANGFVTFGMGFVANLEDGGSSEAGEEETLFVSLDVGGLGAGNGELATLDTTSFDIDKIAFFSPSVPNAELTGTGDGRLFAFSPSMNDGGTFIAQIDPTTGKVIAADPVPGIVQGEGWAFGFWGDEFYTFTTPGTSSSNPADSMTVVHRFNPMTKTVTKVATSSDTIVGAGVSTCAPVSL